MVGITGHRKLDPAQVPALRAQVRAFFLDLHARYPELPLMLVSPLAEGSDQLVAQLALDLGLPVIAPLPLPAALYRADFEDPQSRAIFDAQLAQVRVVTVPLPPGCQPGDVEQPGPARDRQYERAGAFVSRHCHLLLALWDGAASDRVGGTAQTVHFHLFGDPRQPGAASTAAPLVLEEEALVHHLPTRRAGGPFDGGSKGRWLTAEAGLVAHADLPDTFDRTFRKQMEFNADARKYAQTMTIEGPAAAEASTSCPIDLLFFTADWLARTYQRRVHRVLLAVYVLAAAMGVAFFLYTHVSAQSFVIHLFLLFFVAGLGLVSISRRRDWQRKYIDYRALAEGLRVQSYWRRAGVVDMQSSGFAHDNFTHRQDSELGWIRNVMRYASLEGLLAPTQAGPAQVDAVIAEWIGDEGQGGQLHYFARAGAHRARVHHRAEWAGRWCLWAGVALSVVLAVFSGRLEPELQHILVSAMGIVSVAAAVHEAYAYKKADKELIKQYRYMQRMFTAAARRLQGCRNVGEQQRILRLLGQAALSEHAEWTLLHRERPVEHSRI